MAAFLTFKMFYMIFASVFLIFELLKYCVRSQKIETIVFFPWVFVGVLSYGTMIVVSFFISQEMAYWFILLAVFQMGAWGYLHIIVSFGLELRDNGFLYRGFFHRKRALEYSKINKVVMVYGGIYLYVENKKYLIPEFIKPKTMAQLIIELKRRKIPFHYKLYNH